MLKKKNVMPKSLFSQTKKIRKPIEHKEDNELIAVCTWLSYQYPNLVFFIDFYDKMSFNMKKKFNLCRSKSNPDLFIAYSNKNNNGLFIEMKKSGEVLLNKTGDFKNEHLQKQNECLQQLKHQNYFATFAIGFDNAKEIITTYLNS